MSLASIITTAGAGISNTQYQIGVTNSNIANASDTTYSRKSYQSTSYDTATSALTQGVVTRVANAYLSKAVIQNSAASGRDAVISQYMSYYDSALGSVGGSSDISSLTSSLQSALSSLTTSPSSNSAKTQVINAASALASGISGLSDEIQSLRTQADQQIGSEVSSINDTLSNLASLNNQIAQATNLGSDATSLQDQRDAALNKLSSMIGISYYTGADNRVVIYGDSGDLLLGSQAAKLSYTPSSALAPGVTYPGQIGGIMLNGKDITASLKSGAIGGLIDLRDNSLVAEQSKLDALTSGLIAQANTAANQGTAYPPPNSLTSATTMAATDAFTGTGTVRIAVLGSDGTVVSSQDLNLASYPTVSSLMAALNGISGLSASLSSSGNLVLQASSSANGVSIGASTSSVGSPATDFSSAFGFNNLFSGASSNDIKVAATSNTLTTATLSTAVTLAVGDRGISSGDPTAVQAMTASLTAQIGFPAAGGFQAQTSSVQAYASSFVSAAAQVVSAASSKADSSKSAYDYAQSTLQNQTAVNLDEENTMLVQLQNQYTANAQLISAAKELFQVLINMMSAT